MKFFTSNRRKQVYEQNLNRVILTLKQKLAAVLVIVASAVELHSNNDFENDLNMTALQTNIIIAPNIRRVITT